MIGKRSNQAKHISKVCNLLQVTVGRVLQGHESAEELSLDDRSKRLKTKLSELAQDKSRPNNALYAETLLLLHRFNEAALSGEQEFDEIWIGLSNIIDRARGLGEYPAEMLDSVLEVLSPLGADSEALDDLIEKLAEFMADRSRDLQAGRAYLNRGLRKLEAEKPVAAIKFLGRAVVNLMKDESKEDQHRALYCLAVAYKEAGLLWAARGAAMGAVAQICTIAETDGETPAELIPTLNLFTMIALQLGHVTDFLNGIQFLIAAHQSLPLDDDSRERLSDKLQEFDRLFACFLVSVSNDQISRLVSFPDILDELQLFTARMTILYRLGYLDLLKNDGSIPDHTSDDEIHEMMSILASQPASRDLPKKVVLLDDEHYYLETRIMGINIRVSSPRNVEGFLLAEAHVSFAEAFYSTLLNAGVYPHRENLNVDIVQGADLDKARIRYSDVAGTLTVTLPHSWNPNEVDSHSELNQHLVNFGCEVLVKCFALPDPQEMLETLIGIERGLERATLFCRTGNTRNRFLGSPVSRVADWTYLIEREYPLKDDAPSITPKGSADKKFDTEKNDFSFGELNNHRDLAVSSIINQSLWDKAGWQGMMFGISSPVMPPFLGLVFDNEEVAKAIFTEWQKRFGRDDSNDEIRISLIKGIDKKNPFYYRGCISRDMDLTAKSDFRQFVTVARMTVMTVQEHTNLDMFSNVFGSVGSYYLIPAVLDNKGKPQIFLDHSILKHKLHIRHAWEIGCNDMDSMAVTPRDDVIIPEGETSPPVHELMEWRRKMEKKQVSNGQATHRTG
ncbi:hypothetical protein [Oricola indica]|uniref:hypothetical protein n=1 Tax=Oricola indica TaxID=2872591 RepID=UPI001CBDCCE4|nr:hypothetical protein [Oricola indica]